MGGKNGTMAGLRMICKMYGSMKVSSDGRSITYVWDYAADEPVEKSEMRARAEFVRKNCVIRE